MPEISRFFGIIISMYFDDHNPPHFHAQYNEYEADFDLDGNILDGKLPAKQTKIVAGWAALHTQELIENWEDASNGVELTSIRGVRA